MNRVLDYSDIAPYRDHEVPQAVRALLEAYSFLKVMKFVYPEMSKDEIISLCHGIRTVHDFQKHIASPAMRLMIDKTITELTYDGFENLNGSGHLFISNHRDIILDSALMNILLLEHKLETTETAIGSNLLTNPTVRHLTKLNKNFTVQRGVNSRELYETSLKVSNYMRETISNGVGIWISQREGRAKDGNDRTQQGLLKMIGLSSRQGVKQGFIELKIRPLALSYEYDPCDIFKVRELVETQQARPYVKQEHEDLENIIAGIVKPKGHVHMSIGPDISEEIDEIDEYLPMNDQVAQIGQIIDLHIHKQCRLWPNNYIALDLLEGTRKYENYYRPENEEKFLSYMENVIESLPTSPALAKRILLKKYAYPLQNNLEALAAKVQ